MKILSLRLENFRNFADETFEFTDGINILAGNNAQGKTNCIEAIYFCSCLKSYRVLKEEQLITRSSRSGYRMVAPLVSSL